MPQRPPSNSARKIAAQPVERDDATATLSTEERRTVAPDLLLESGLVLEKYKLPVLLAVAVLVLAAVGWGVYQSHEARTAAAAGARLDSAATAADYQKVIDTYPGTTAAADAWLLLGRKKYDAKDYPGAAQTWQEFAAKFPQNPLAPDALAGQASALEAQGKLDEARALYQRVATSYASSYAAPLARISEATLLLAQGKTGDAKHAYEDVIASSPNTQAGRMAEQGLQTINALPAPGATPFPSPAAVTAPAPAASGPAPAAPVAPAAVAPPAVPVPAAVAPADVAAPAVTPSPAALTPPAVAVPSASPAPGAPVAETPDAPAANPANSPAAAP